MKKLIVNTEFKITLPECVREVITVLSRAGYYAYASGECLLYTLRGNEVKDFDIVANADYPTVLSLIDTRYPPSEYSENAGAAAKSGDGAKIPSSPPAVKGADGVKNSGGTDYRSRTEYFFRHEDMTILIRFVRKSILEVLAERVFSVYAMAYNDYAGLVDPYGGLDCIGTDLILLDGICEPCLGISEVAEAEGGTDTDVADTGGSEAGTEGADIVGAYGAKVPALSQYAKTSKNGKIVKNPALSPYAADIRPLPDEPPVYTPRYAVDPNRTALLPRLDNTAALYNDMTLVEAVVESYRTIVPPAATPPFTAADAVSALVKTADVGYALTERTVRLIKPVASEIVNISRERGGKVLDEIILGRRVTDLLLDHRDVIFGILPELAVLDEHGLYEPAARAAGFAVPDVTLRLALLFRDLGKPDTMAVYADGSVTYYGSAELARIYAGKLCRRLGFSEVVRGNICFLAENQNFMLRYAVPAGAAPHSGNANTNPHPAHAVSAAHVRTAIKFALTEHDPADVRLLTLMQSARARAYGDEELANSLRRAADEVFNVVNSGEPYTVAQLAINFSDVSRYVKNEAVAQTAMDKLLDLVIENPAFNTRARLTELLKNLHNV